MNDWMRSGTEPALDEMLGDPIVMALMRRDGVTERHVRDIVARVRGRRSHARRRPAVLPVPVPSSSF